MSIKPNIYNLDVFEGAFDDMQFDVIVGNPPYQKETAVIKDANNKQGGLWWEIVKNTIDLIEDDGVIAMVIPSSLFSTGGFGSKSNKIGQINSSGIFFEKIWTDVSSSFKVGIKISAFVAKKKNIDGHEYRCKLVDLDQEVNFDTRAPIPFNIDKDTVSIVNKCYNITNKWPFKEIDKSSPDDYVVKINGGRFKNYNKLFVGKSSDTSHNHQTMIINEANVENVYSIFNSKLFAFIFKSLGGESGQSSTGILQSLPYCNVEEKWTDEKLYKHFDLTETEIEYIEANSK